MPLEILREAIRSGFDREDRVTLYELRQPGWERKLGERGKLQVAHHHQVVGVLVSPAFWDALGDFVAYVEELEDRLEQLDIERMWGDRVRHEHRPARVEAERLRMVLCQEEE